MTETGSLIVEIPLERIIILGDNPRQYFDEESLRRLGESIKEQGQVQSVLVRPRGSDYELVVGERRVRACALVGLPTVKAEVRDMDDAATHELRLIENVHREDLSDAEKGDAVYVLIANYDKYNTIKDVADAINVPYKTVQTVWCPKTRKLSKKVKEYITSNILKDRHAPYLLKYPHSVQDKLARAIIKHKIPSSKVGDFTKLYDADPKRNLDDIANEVLGIKTVTISESELTDKQKKDIEKREKEKRVKKKTLPPDELRCIAITGSGTRCKNKRLTDKEYCEQHDPEKAEKKPFKYKKVKVKRDSTRSYSDPKKRSFDVWNIAAIDLEKPFGDPDYPGAIPGDIVANVLMWFLSKGGKVVDPMAGGGVTEDVCNFLDSNYEVLLYDNFSLPDYKYRESINFNDITTNKLPEEANGADLIFADPPYGPQKEYGMPPDRLYSLLEGLAEASYNALKPKGLVSVLMQNYYLEDECVGEFFPIIRKTAEIFERKTEEDPPRFKQIFEATVPLYGKVARSEEHMTHIDRRLMLFRKEGS